MLCFSDHPVPCPNIVIGHSAAQATVFSGKDVKAASDVSGTTRPEARTILRSPHSQKLGTE